MTKGGTELDGIRIAIASLEAYQATGPPMTEPLSNDQRSTTRMLDALEYLRKQLEVEE